MPKLKVSGVQDLFPISREDAEDIEAARKAGAKEVRLGETTYPLSKLIVIPDKMLNPERDTNVMMMLNLGFTEAKDFPFGYSIEELKKFVGSFLSEYLHNRTNVKTKDNVPLTTRDEGIIAWAEARQIIRRQQNGKWAIVWDGASMNAYHDFEYRLRAIENMEERKAFAQGKEDERIEEIAGQKEEVGLPLA